VRPVALVTGAGRRRGIASAVAQRLVESGWDVAFTHLGAYDARMPWGVDAGAARELADQLQAAGARSCSIEADFTDVQALGRVVDQVRRDLGPIGALVLGHCESVATGIMDTSVESFDRHFTVNARAGWLLIREYVRQFPGPRGSGRIIALTSDHTAGIFPTARRRAHSTGSLSLPPGSCRGLGSPRTASTRGPQTTAG
jgi:3-oxoacyl-[acyl-carrier protein] reductase